MLRGGAMPRTKIEGVIGIHTIGDGGESTVAGDLVEHGEKLVFAEITAIRRVGAIGGIFQLMCFHKFMRETKRMNELLNLGTVVRRKTGGKRGEREGLMAERAVRSPGQVSGVGASRQSNQERRKGRQAGKQELLFLIRSCFRRLAGIVLFGIMDVNKSFHLRQKYTPEAGSVGCGSDEK